MPNVIQKYGAKWDADSSDLAQIECYCIQQSDSWRKARGTTLFQHYKSLFRLYWPEDDENRWEDEILKAILDNQFTTIMGCAASGKTTTAAKFALCFYGVYPTGTSILISSTDMRGLELRVFGRIKELIQRAKDRFDWFPGFVIDSKKMISTDDIEESEVRDLRQGLICIPCLSSAGSFVGLGKYQGIHNDRVMFIGDEFALMQLSLLDSIPNLINNKFFKAVFLGNPLAQGDPLDYVSEPEGGWAVVGIPTKTIRWTTRYMKGLCLNLPGLDSPNFDYPSDQPDKFPYMVGRRKVAQIKESYGEESQQYCAQILGVRIAGMNGRKVITKEICEKFGAFDKAIWMDGDRKKVYAIDAAYGGIGGDRCQRMICEFGKGIDGKMIFSIESYKTIPVSAISSIPPDDQIAEFAKMECEAEEIEPSSVFFDGRTLLAAAFARLWSVAVNPVDFGGRVSERPVCADMIIDTETGARRLKRCDEHYSKFVTEMWWSVRYAVESGQLRGMTEEILSDGTAREWRITRGNKIEIETKSEMKKRTGRSPDIFDSLVTALEGARRLGFIISKLGNPDAKKKTEGDWYLREFAKLEKLRQSRQLATA